MTSSKRPAARRMTSTWPLVTGSNEPGQTQRVGIPSTLGRDLVVAGVPDPRLAITALALGPQPGRPARLG